MDSSPPCARPGEPLNPCAVALLEHHAYGNTWLAGPWMGWRVVRGVLVSPDGARVTVEQLGALLALRSGSAGRAGGRAAVRGSRTAPRRPGRSGGATATA